MSKKNLTELLPERVYTAFIEDRFHESELHGDSKPTVTQMLTYMDRFTIEAIAKARKYGLITPGTVGQWLRFDKKTLPVSAHKAVAQDSSRARLWRESRNIKKACWASTYRGQRRYAFGLRVASPAFGPTAPNVAIRANRFFLPDGLADILNAPLPGAAAPVATTIAYAKGLVVANNHPRERTLHASSGTRGHE